MMQRTEIWADPDPRPDAADRRRLRAMKRKGLRWIMAHGVEGLHEAMRVSLMAPEYVAGIVLDRGAAKDHGIRERYTAAYGYNGEPCYHIRKPIHLRRVGVTKGWQ